MSQEKIETITINNVEYVRKDSIQSNVFDVTGLKYVIIRTYSAGVFAGYLKSRNGQECEIIKARKIYYWEGAATLSQLAQSGTSKPDKCKFPEEVNSLTVLQAIEILDVTPEAKKSIDSVKIWKA